jgi:hypothetical protein
MPVVDEWALYDESSEITEIDQGINRTWKTKQPFL